MVTTMPRPFISVAPFSAMAIRWNVRAAICGTRPAGTLNSSTSDHPDAMAGYPRETQEMVFDAHDRAFAFFVVL